MSFLGFEGKKFLVLGVANRKSVAYFIADTIRKEGGHLILSTLNQEKKDRESGLKDANISMVSIARSLIQGRVSSSQ